MRFGQARVIETRDVRVRQRREDLALACHPFGEVRALPRLVGKFQCDRSIDEAVASFGQPDDSHTAAAQLADQSVRPDRVAWPIAIDRDVGEVRQIGVELWKGLEKRRIVSIRSAPEQLTQTRLERGMLRAQQVDPPVPG